MTCPGSIDYNNGNDQDLRLSLGKVKYDLEGYKLADGSWNIKVYLYDIYDFEKKDYDKKYSLPNVIYSCLSLANNSSL